MTYFQVTHARGILILTSTGSSCGSLHFGAAKVYVGGNGGQNARSLEMESFNEPHMPIEQHEAGIEAKICSGTHQAPPARECSRMDRRSPVRSP